MALRPDTPGPHLSRGPKAIASPVWAANPEATTLGLLDLIEHTCRWPLGANPTRFCGEHTEPDKSYCKAHCAIAYHPAPPFRLKKPRNT